VASIVNRGHSVSSQGKLAIRATLEHVLGNAQLEPQPGSPNREGGQLDTPPANRGHPGGSRRVGTGWMVEAAAQLRRGLTGAGGESGTQKT
jgi:hypothetical protein